MQNVTYFEQNKKKLIVNILQRKSGVELLRIFAIFLICLSHALQTSYLFYGDASTFSFVSVVRNLLRYSGYAGNIIFIICSSWFLLDSKHTKLEKILSILIDSTVISIICFISVYFSYGTLEVDSSIIFRQFFPDVYGMMWFIPAYILLYALHPLLNIIINNINKKQHLIILITLLILFSGSNLLGFSKGGEYDYVASGYLFAFIEIYFFIAYEKKYHNDYCKNKKINTIVLIVSLTLFVILAILKFIFSSKSSFLRGFGVGNLDSIIFVLPLFSMFNLFNSFKFYSKTINYLASCSLFVYCIHENYMLRTYVRISFYQYAFSNFPGLSALIVLICAIGMFVGGFIIALIYKNTIHRFTVILSKEMKDMFSKVFDYFYNLCQKNNKKIEK